MKFKLLAGLLAAAALLSGCSLKEAAQQEDMVVAIVNGTEIYRSQVREMADSYAQNNGIDVDSDNEVMQQQYSQIANTSLDSYVINEVLLQKAPEVGVSLTDDEKAALRGQSDERFASVRESLRAGVEEDAKINASIDVDKVTEDKFQAYLKEKNTSPDSYYEFLCEQAIVSKVTNYIYGLAALTDEDLKAWYDEALATEMDEMQSVPEAFEAYVHQRNIYVYVPEDTVAVKQVLLTFDDEELVTAATTLYNEGKRDAAFDVLQPEIDRLMPTARQVAQRIRGGEPIEDLINELGEDPNITTDPYKIYGYLLDSRTTRYGDEFREAALGLMNVGDVSDPFASLYGLHVLQSIKVYEEGAIPFEDVSEQIRDALLSGKETEKFAETVQQWVSEADIVYYRERLL